MVMCLQQTETLAMRSDNNGHMQYINGGLRIRLPAKIEQRFKDKTKYTRKPKHKKKDES